jgi:hypothetical protein
LLLEESGKNTIWNICDNTEESEKIPYGISIPTQETCYSSIV